MANSVSPPQGARFDEKTIQITVPPDWRVEACGTAIALLFGAKSLKPQGDRVVIAHTPME